VQLIRTGESVAQGCSAVDQDSESLVNCSVQLVRTVRALLNGAMQLIRTGESLLSDGSMQSVRSGGSVQVIRAVRA
jgi:hypothetical protein